MRCQGNALLCLQFNIALEKGIWDTGVRDMSFIGAGRGEKLPGRGQGSFQAKHHLSSMKF